jgi:hypothetical protein
VVTAAEPSRIVPNNLLPTCVCVHSGYPVLLTAFPQPATIGVLLHSLPLKSRTRSNFDIAAVPNHVVRLGGVLVRIQRHSTREIPVAELGNRPHDEDVVAPLGTHFDGEGEGDGFGVRASGRGVCDGEADGRAGFADAGGMDLEAVVVGIHGAVIGHGGVIEETVGRTGEDHLRGGGVVTW